MLVDGMFELLDANTLDDEGLAGDESEELTTGLLLLEEEDNDTDAEAEGTTAEDEMSEERLEALFAEAEELTKLLDDEADVEGLALDDET